MNGLLTRDEARDQRISLMGLRKKASVFKMHRNPSAKDV